MNGILKKHAMAAVVILICLLVGIFFGTQKSGMFIDEIYTYGLSNGYYTPFIRTAMDGDMTDKVLTGEALYAYLTVGEEDAFALDSVYDNQTQDVHPPLYYMLLHIVSSLCPGVFSKWLGLSLNLVLFAALLVLLYMLAYRLMKNTTAAAVTVLLYALSHSGLSTVVMIRMYILMTLLTVVLAYLILRLCEQERWYWYPGIGAAIFAGLFTQYYFVIYAFFVCAAYVIYALCKKKYRPMLVFAGSVLLAVAAFVLAYPAVLTHMTANQLVSGSNAVENVTNIGGWISRILQYFNAVRTGLTMAIAVGAAGVLLVLVRFKKIGQAIQEEPAGLTHGCVLLIPAFAAFVVVAIISPVFTVRYLYNVLPLFALTAGYVLSLTVRTLKEKHARWVTFLVPVLALLMLVKVVQTPPDYLYPEHAQYNELLAAYQDSPCVYFNDNYNAPVTQDALQLVLFEDVYITNDAASEGLLTYVSAHENAENIVVYVDVDEFWSSNFDAEAVLNEFLENTGYKEYKLLYKQGLSEAYVIS